MNVSIDGLLEMLAERLAERVAAKLGHVAVAVYTTAKRGPHCPGKSRTWMLRNVRSMPGAKKVGRDWLISAEDYQRWAAAKDAGRRAVESASPANSVDAVTDAFLREAGLRRTGRGTV